MLSAFAALAIAKPLRHWPAAINPFGQGLVIPCVRVAVEITRQRPFRRPFQECLTQRAAKILSTESANAKLSAHPRSVGGDEARPVVRCRVRMPGNVGSGVRQQLDITRLWDQMCYTC